jgi:hypothetical protein
MQNLENKCRILSDLWIHHKDEEKEEDFIEDYDLYELIRYADLSLPLSYLVNAELVTPKEESIKLIDEAYAILVEFLDLDANEDFETLRQIANELENQDS